MRGRKNDGDDTDPTACFLCGTTVPSAYRVICARCKAIYYCSARCRDFHSRRYGHAGEECRQAAAEAAMTEVGAGGGGNGKGSGGAMDARPSRMRQHSDWRCYFYATLSIWANRQCDQHLYG